MEELRPVFAGRKVVLTGGPLAAMTGMCRRLRDLGAERPFLLATGVGTGEVPGADEAEWCVVEVRAPDVITEIRAAMRLLRLVPGEVVAALDRWDPERRALVLSPMFNELPEIAGRRVYGPRRAEWRRLEDKVVVDGLWDELGVTRAPSEVVAAEPAALRAAARRLDRGAGTAWAGDARQGFNGGAFCLRWVRDEEDAVEAVAFLAERCDRVRVMPFLEGIPCSIHGVVVPHGVATFRPVEMVTLRRPGSNRLRYAGAATFWDPPEPDREVMRDLARRVGDGLRERVGYRGAFTVDGVLAAEGFLPTELNPRPGAGLSMMTRDLPDLPVALLDRALIEGERLTFGADDLERQVLRAADRVRAGGAWTVTEVATGATRDLPVVFEGGACRPATDGQAADGMVSFGPSGVGGFVRVALDPARVPAGPSVAPLAVAAFALADERFGSGIGPLEMARAVR
ncbi:MAG TPA: hypothetical protein VFS70_23250 [Actinomycetota bacterium]|nr:hypothetical protein [Actinomycetota bacterium]